MGRGRPWLLTLFFLVGVTCILVLLVGLAVQWIGVKDGLGSGDRVAVLRLEGMVVDARFLLEALDRHGKDPRVKAMVLRVDTPGGAVAPTQEIFRAVRAWNQRKKVVASLGSMATSGGYYAACGAERIVANPGTITGSIGVVVHLANLEGLLEKLGIKGEVVKSGEHKDMGSMYRPLTDLERGLLQEVVDDVHDQFVQDVARSRSLEVEKVRAVADGRLFSGRQAQKLGLVDELGGLQEAIQLAARLGGVKGEPVVVEEPKERFSLLNLILGGSRPGFFPGVDPASLTFLFHP
ncbi:MAG: signal peptide peptidase SppA [Thermodesulfobacteriota bacterium]